MKSRQSLLEGCASLFKKHNTDKIFATTDGQYFLDHNRAHLHARSKKKMKVYELEASDLKEQDDKGNSEIHLLNAKTTIAAIKTIQDVEKLNTFLTEETEGKNRKSVIEAIENQIESLKVNE